MSAAMTISEFRKFAGLSQAKFAELMTASGYSTTQALVSQWESGQVELTAERCRQIEEVTGGQVLRVTLRKDLFGPIATSGEAA